MISFKPIISLAVLWSLLFIFGCSNTEIDKKTKEKHIKFDLITSAKTSPSNFHEIAFKRKETPFYQYLVSKVNSQNEFEETWNLYNLETKTPNIDLNKKDVFFIGVRESGSCPYNIGNINLNPENKTMTVSLTEPTGVCTSDATPRTFVIQINKEISKDIKSIVIVESRVETRIPFEN